MTSAPPPPSGPPSQPPPPPGGWGGPPPGSIYPTDLRTTTTSGLAIASLVTGLFFWCFVIPGVVAVILGYLALEQIEDSEGTKRGRGMAIAGIVLGWVGIALVGLAVLGWDVWLLTST